MTRPVALSAIDWSSRVANVDAFGEKEKELWNQIEPILNDVLDELKRNGFIETIFVQKEADALWSCISKQDTFSHVSNVLLHLSDKEKASKFVKLNAQFGLDEATVVAAYIMTVLSLSVLKTELFKLFLLFHMKRGRGVSHRVSSFNITMKGSAPDNWPKLEPFVDSPLRNALAHGTYALVNHKIVLFDDARLEPLEELQLSDIMMRTKDQDVLFQCLINVIQRKTKEGLFTPETPLKRG
jgi:hypothetical protein